MSTTQYIRLAKEIEDLKIKLLIAQFRHNTGLVDCYSVCIRELTELLKRSTNETRTINRY